MEVLIFSDTNGFYGIGRGAGPYRLASELRSHGFSTKIIEFFSQYSMEEIRQILDRYVDEQTLFVGFSTSHFASANPKRIKKWLTTYDKVREHKTRVTLFPFEDEFMSDIFAYVKKRNHKTKIVIGGHKVELSNEHPGVDYWVWGEGDVSAIELARYLKGEPVSLKTERAPVGEKILSKRDYPFDEFSTSRIAWTEYDNVRPHEHVPIEIARGCAFNCSYCYFTKKKPGTYIKTPDVVRNELIDNYERFGITGYMLSDDTYNDSIQKVRTMHEVFTSLPFQVEWSSFARIDMLYHHPEMIELMLESGARAIFFGIETLHPGAAKKIGKPLDPEKVKETLCRVKEVWCNKVLISAGFIIGLPGETEQSVYSTFDWVTRPDSPVDAFSFGPLTVRPFVEENSNVVVYSKFTKQPENYGLRVQAGPRGTDWEHENMSLTRAEEIVQEFANSEAHRKRNRVFGVYTAYSRMRNLGYEFQDIYSRMSLDSDWYEDHEARKTKIKEAYLKKILS